MIRLHGRRTMPESRAPSTMTRSRSAAMQPRSCRFMSTVVSGGRAWVGMISQLSRPTTATSSSRSVSWCSAARYDALDAASQTYRGWRAFDDADIARETGPLGIGRSSGPGPSALLFLEVESTAVHAEPHPARLSGTVWEDMAEMAVAPSALHFRAHQRRRSDPRSSSLRRERLGETRPSRAGFKFGVAGEERIAAAGATVRAVVLGIEVRPLNGRSVPCLRSTEYCSGVSRCRHSSSVVGMSCNSVMVSSNQEARCLTIGANDSQGQWAVQSCARIWSLTSQGKWSALALHEGSSQGTPTRLSLIRWTGSRS